VTGKVGKNLRLRRGKKGGGGLVNIIWTGEYAVGSEGDFQFLSERRDWSTHGRNAPFRRKGNGTLTLTKTENLPLLVGEGGRNQKKPT